MIISGSIANHLLIAMPQLTDPNFKQTVIYVCEDSPKGSVGLIINRLMPFPLGVVFEQMDIPAPKHEPKEWPLMFGGPVSPERGFVIHRPLGTWHSSIVLGEGVTVTTSSDIIRAIALNEGPKDMLVTLGYSGWEEAQLSQEIMNNIWLVCPFRAEILYEVPFAERWHYAGSILGVKMNEVSSMGGRAQ
jgi:putative transcriptional regulator